MQSKLSKNQEEDKFIEEQVNDIIEERKIVDFIEQEEDEVLVNEPFEIQNNEGEQYLDGEDPDEILIQSLESPFIHKIIKVQKEIEEEIKLQQQLNQSEEDKVS